MRRQLYTILVLFCFSHSVFAQSHRADKVDVFIEQEMKRKGIPGLAFAVVKNNAVLKMKAYGYANLDHLIPTTTQTVFPIASVDKQIIATCIMMLHEQGKLSLDDAVTKYLDSVPSSWRTIQIRHLLSHTSGLADDPLENSKGRGFDRYTSSDIFRHISRQNLAYRTAEKFLYTDAGYFLLQQIFEKASGLYYPTFVREKIFIPLEMNQTRILDPTEVVKGRSVSYYKNSEDKILINNFRQISLGPHFGDIGTTIEDFVKYDIAINTNRLLKRETYQLMWKPATVAENRVVSQLADEQTLFNAGASYGYGWELSRFQGRTVVYHSGFTGTSITKFPEEGLSVLLLTNLTYRPVFSPNALAKQIASFYLEKKQNAPITKSTQNQISNFEHLIAQFQAHTIDSSLFEKTFYQMLLPALPDYRRKIIRYGNLKQLLHVHTTPDKSDSIQTFKADYEKGTLFYQVTINTKGQITFISIE